jgi:CheY-like chemotaxis protein
MLTILLVDDNVHLQIAFKKVLTSSGYQVELAGDGEEGLRLALSTRPDVILLDMLLPKLGGVEVLLALKANRVTATIPVIALSGLPMSNEARLRRDGAISCLQKSNLEDLDVLLQAIYTLLLPRDLRGHLKSGQWSLQNRPTECGLGRGQYGLGRTALIDGGSCC